MAIKLPDPKKLTPADYELLRQCGNAKLEVAHAAQVEIVKALTLPLKQGVLKGDITSGIFQAWPFLPGQSTEFPIDFLNPGSEKEFIAYTVPKVGRIPEQHVEGDYLMVPTFDVGASIDTALRYIRDGRWDIMGRMMQVLEAMFTRKKNADAWHTIVAAGVGRNLIAWDDAATAGLFTKRLVELMRITMRRNAGGNSTSTNRGKLTDLFISPESLGDVRSWDLTQIPDAIREKIYLDGGDKASLNTIPGMQLHDLDELGVGQEFELYFENPSIGGVLPSDKKEIVVGLDLENNDSFVNPIRQEVEVFEDIMFHRQNRAGMYARMEHGYGVLDGRRVLLGAA